MAHELERWKRLGRALAIVMVMVAYAMIALLVWLGVNLRG